VLGSPTIGRDAIRDSMAVIFGQMYADVRTVVHHTLVEGDTGAARFTMSATALFADGKSNEDEYSLWIRTVDGRIVRVWEYLDVAHAARQLGV